MMNHSYSRLLRESILFALVKLIHSHRAQVDYLWTTVSILLQLHTLFTVISISSANAVADETSVLIGAVVALIAYPHQDSGSNIRVADHTLAITLVAQPANRYPNLLPAHDQIWMMLSHLQNLKPKSIIIIQNNRAFSLINNEVGNK